MSQMDFSTLNEDQLKSVSGEVTNEMVKKVVDTKIQNLHQVIADSVRPLLQPLERKIDRNYRMNCKIQNMNVYQKQSGLFVFPKKENNNNQEPPTASIGYEQLFEMGIQEINRLLNYYELDNTGGIGVKLRRIINHICGN